MRLRPDFPFLYPILDSAVLPEEPSARRVRLLQLVRPVFDAGISILQYRDKKGSDQQVLEDARWIRDAAGPEPTLILNDRVHLVDQASFDGAHVGQTDMAPSEARKILGPGKVLGVSTHNPDQLKQADSMPVDYLAIGPVFPTATKEKPDPVVGLEGVRRARTLTQKPLVAIGGITAQSAHLVIEAGADCVALVSAIFSPASDQDSVRKNIEDILRIFM